VRLDLTPQLAVHDAVRRDLVRLTQVLGGTGAVDADRGRALRDHWVLVLGVLSAHERAEETALWPALRDVLNSDDCGRVEAALAQHHQLDTAAADAARLFADPRQLIARATRDELAGAVERLAVLADHHFALEEDRLLPLADQQLAVACWSAFVAEWRAAPGPGGVEAVLPFLLEGAPPDRAGSLLSTFGRGDQASYAGSWRPAHLSRTSALW
jgi:hypothetical protein